MTTENPYPWADGMDCAVTVCDTGGTILYMNDKARTTFARHGDMVGKNLFDCHGERSADDFAPTKLEPLPFMEFSKALRIAFLALRIAGTDCTD